jgi:hypothetical protein
MANAVCCVARYEELKRQLAEAQEAAQIEDEEAELARAADTIARLTAPAAASALAKPARGQGGASPPALLTGGDGNYGSPSKLVICIACICPPYLHAISSRS